MILLIIIVIIEEGGVSTPDGLVGEESGATAPGYYGTHGADTMTSGEKNVHWTFISWIYLVDDDDDIDDVFNLSGSVVFLFIFSSFFCLLPSLVPATSFGAIFVFCFPVFIDFHFTFSRNLALIFWLRFCAVFSLMW